MKKGQKNTNEYNYFWKFLFEKWENKYWKKAKMAWKFYLNYILINFKFYGKKMGTYFEKKSKTIKNLIYKKVKQ
jgi:hypothetical protein